MLPTDYELDCTVEPAAEPMTLAEAKLWLKVTQAITDDEISSLLRTVREEGELQTGRSWLTKTLVLRLRCWPSDGELELPVPPLLSVSSVKYYDTSSVQQTLSAALYFVTPSTEGGKVTLKNDAEWPDLEDLGRPFPIEVTFVAGYGPAGSDLPGPCLNGYRLLLGHLMQNRTQEETGTIVAPRARGVDECWSLVRRHPI